ncbi:hypothetical protein B0T18DRAFT_386608 [Schizothecium vesticola]|uniref:Uncharacterized protein n=1 Tax=Schizothecium vesticola TaxID=314040 RepID=A0AA40KDE2_9PEZI|nr:hypothetical protein B0T18DRAFT_386608 [Schizothecium vesticola]
MGASFSVIKTLIIPAIISLALYLLSHFLLIPLWRHYHLRYSTYLPLDTIQTQTSSIRAKVSDWIVRLIAKPLFSRSGATVVVADPDSGASDSEDGEELGRVNQSARAAHGQNSGSVDSSRRLSRDLEEGFMDDSDEELPEPTGRRR